MNLFQAASIRRACCSSSLLLVLVYQGYAARHERLINAWQPTNFDITIKLSDGLAEISKARTEVMVQVLKNNLTVIDFDFGELPIDGVWIDGKAARFDKEKAKGLLNVHLQNAASKGQQLLIAVEYHGKPQDGLILTKDKDGKPSATGDNWPDRVHHWIPCLDHPSAKAKVTFRVTAPANELVVANGRLDQVKDDSPTNRTWTYSEGVRIPAYCMVIAVGEYAKSQPSLTTITPLTFYVPESDRNRVERGFAAAAPALKFFSETIAPYPYEKLAMIVGATQFGGMENSSAIVFANNLLSPRLGPPQLSRAFNVDQGLEEVVGHEIAHQWFGDSVTESTWSDLWLSEGFATYFSGLVLEKYDGQEAFQAYLKRAANSYFRYEKKIRTPIHDTETEKLFDLLNGNNYQKGAWVLHMLRSQLGEKAFFRGIRIYYEAHKESTAGSEDLRKALEQASGRDLKTFFARWIYGTGHPQYQLHWSSADNAGSGSTLSIRLTQTQPDDPFLDPVPIEVTSNSATRRLVIQPTGRVTEASFSLTAAAKDVKIDPDETLLKEISSSN